MSNSDVVQDDAQKSISALVLVTPALTKDLSSVAAPDYQIGLQLQHGGADVSTVETEVDRALPAGSGFSFVDPSVIETEAQRAIKPEAIALGVFGGICGLAVLLIASQIIGRQRRLLSDDLATLRALGASPSALIADGLIGSSAPSSSDHCSLVLSQWHSRRSDPLVRFVPLTLHLCGVRLDGAEPRNGGARGDAERIRRDQCLSHYPPAV